MDGYSSDVFFHGDDDSYGSIDATRDEAICDLGFLGFWVQLNRCMGILRFWIWDCKKFGNLDSRKWRELKRALAIHSIKFLLYIPAVSDRLAKFHSPYSISLIFIHLYISHRFFIIKLIP